MMSICLETWQKVLLLSKETEDAQEKKLEETPSKRQEQEEPSTPTEQDHYVYESIIAEIGY